MYQRTCRGRFLIAVAALLCGPAWAEAPENGDIRVRVETRDELVVIDVEFTVKASARNAWQVLTDFDGMPAFISGIERSRVVARSGRTWRVAQQGVSSAGPLSFSYDSVREITLKPYSEIRGRALAGSMKRMDSVTRLTSGRGVTRITYHAESMPKKALPLGLGAGFIEDRTREQFGEMRTEILRRTAARRK